MAERRGVFVDDDDLRDDDGGEYEEDAYVSYHPSRPFAAGGFRPSPPPPRFERDRAFDGSVSPPGGFDAAAREEENGGGGGPRSRRVRRTHLGSEKKLFVDP